MLNLLIVKEKYLIKNPFIIRWNSFNISWR